MPAAPRPRKTKVDGKETLAVAMAEQFSACHGHVSRWFAMANDDEEYDFATRLDAVKLAARLVQASASAARAVTQIKRGEFHHQITVTYVDYPAEKAEKKARQVRAAKAKEAAGDHTKKLEARIDRILEAARNTLTPEENRAIEASWEQARLRHAKQGKYGAQMTATQDKTP